MHQKSEIKLILVGEPGVGKSTISTCFCPNDLAKPPITMPGITFSTKEVEQKGNASVKLCIWDINNNVDIPADVPYTRGARVAVIVLDGARSAELQKASMSYWFRKIRGDASLEETAGARIYFIVNKIDDPDFKGEDAFNKAVAEWNAANATIPVMFCSANKGTGVTEAFNRMIDEALKSAQTTTLTGGKNTLWEDIKASIANHKLQAGGTAFIIAVSIALFILAASPVGGALAVGVLSGGALAGIVGVGGLILWNAGCFIVNAWKKGNGSPPPAGDGEGVSPRPRKNLNDSKEKELDKVTALYEQPFSPPANSNSQADAATKTKTPAKTLRS